MMYGGPMMFNIRLLDNTRPSAPQQPTTGPAQNQLPQVNTNPLLQNMNDLPPINNDEN